MLPASGVARPLDLSYRTNRAIVLLALGVLLIVAAASALAGTGTVETLTRSVGAALAVFLSWALCREVDPDHDHSALLAAAMMILVLPALPVSDILALLWVLLVIRVVNRTTGRAAATTDLVLLLALTLWPLSRGFLQAGPIAAAAFVLDGRLHGRAPHRLPFAAAALGAAAAALIVTPVHLSAPSPAAWMGIVLATALFVPVIAASKTIHTTGDSGGLPLDPGRVMAGQVLALATVISTAAGDAQTFAPLWAAVLAAGLWHVALEVWGRRPAGYI